MKRILAIILALALCLSITACASKDEKALEAADALLEAGDYQGALEAYCAIETYQMVNERLMAVADALLEQGDTEAAVDIYYSITKFDEIFTRIEEIEAAAIQSRAAAYVGTWKDLRSVATFTIHEDGSFDYQDDYNSDSGMMWMAGGNVVVWGEYEPQEIDGVLHLVNEDSDYVREADYDGLCAKEVAITLENWETYFEMREARAIRRNDFGEVEWADYGYGLFLRTEYVEKLVNNYDGCQVSFKIHHDVESHRVDGDYPNGEFSIGEEYKPSWLMLEPVDMVREVWQNGDQTEAENDFAGYYAAEITGGIWEVDGEYLVQIPVNIEIVDVTGTLKLFP